MHGIVRDAAPVWSERPPAVNSHTFLRSLCKSGKRNRRRGPRSIAAILRRSKVRHDGAPTVVDSGESESDTTVYHKNNQPQFLSILSLNIRCFLHKVAELHHVIDKLQPHVIMIQETWLDQSVGHVKLADYHCISRRDRSLNQNRGGIVLYAKSHLKDIVHLMNSEVAERSWHMLKLDTGNVLIANWYRPPGSDDSHIHSFREELCNFMPMASSCIVAGDLNVHHKRWLRYSNADTSQGQLLQKICNDFDLQEQVRKPTRESYLLDLFLCNISGCKVTVEAKLSDHHCIFARVPLPIPEEKHTYRQIWKFKAAAWQNMKIELRRIDWTRLQNSSVDDAVKYFTDLLWYLCLKFIPSETIKVSKRSHPWLNERCKVAIEKKHSLQDTGRSQQATEECAVVLAEEYRKYKEQLKSKISKLGKNDKRWWQLNKELLNHKAKMSSIPPLRDEDGSWITDSKSKANLFASVWQAKCSLPSEGNESFHDNPELQLDSFIAIRSRQVFHELSHLNCNKATGPDKISAYILKELAEEIACPLAILARRILYEGVWPEVWRIHHLVPIFKRNSSYLAKNYRGVHLTSIVSKVVERCIGFPLIRHLQLHAFGENQWAFTKQRSARDLVALYVSKWIFSLCTGHKVGFFMADISGAFDRVFKNYMMAKLLQAGVGDCYLRFLDSYLEPRVGKVTCEGIVSDVFEIADTVFQGSVLGPALWNCFFADVSFAATEKGGEAALFADDLSIQHEFPASESNQRIFDNLKLSQEAVHKWGKRNRVSFDATKEQYVVIHFRHGEGDPFVLLGNHFDVKLHMDLAVQHVLNKNRPKITAMLRTRGQYGIKDMIMQYKTHIWGHAEYQNAAICHAAPSLLAQIDAMQRRYLHELHLTEEVAFLDHNFLPPRTRRDVAMLGLIHKRVLGTAHPAFAFLLPWSTASSVHCRHNKQLYSGRDKCIGNHALFHRSILGRADMYNRLSQRLVDIDNIKMFQSELTQIIRNRCERNIPTWQSTFDPSRFDIHCYDIV